MFASQSIVHSHGLLAISFCRRSCVRVVACNAVIEINERGQWVKGVEIYMPAFNLRRAVEWMGPVSPGEPISPGYVTYDPEADAAYFYLLHSNASGAPGDNTFEIASSREVEAEWRLAADGSLVGFGIPLERLGSIPSDFAALLRSDNVDDLPDQ